MSSELGLNAYSMPDYRQQTSTSQFPGDNYGRASAVPSSVSRKPSGNNALVAVGSNQYASAADSNRNHSRAPSVQGAARAMTPISAAPSHIQLQQQYKAFQLGDNSSEPGHAAPSTSPSLPQSSVPSKSDRAVHPALGQSPASSISTSNQHNSTVHNSSARGTSGSIGRPVKLVASRKVKVIDYLRRSLLPVHHRGALTRDDMVVVCSTVCRDFMDQAPYSNEQMAETSSVPLTREDESLLSTLLLTTLKDLNTIKARGSAAATPHQMEGPSGYSAKVTPLPSVSKERRPSATAITHHTPIAPTQSNSFGATALSAAGGHSTALADSTLHTVLSNQSASRSAVSAPKAPPSLFQSVSYTISGAFPRGETNSAAAYRSGTASGDGRLPASPYQQAVLKVSITSPSVQDADGDIVVIGNVTTSVPVALIWWLGYGPQRTVLNLDKLYTNGLVATYQITDTSFILTFKRGALVAGWDYGVYLRVTSPDGTSVSASTTFVIPALTDEREAAATGMGLPDQRVGNNKHRALAPNPYSGRTQEGYYGDGDINDDEHMSKLARFGPPSGYGNSPQPSGVTPSGARHYDPAPQPLSSVAGEPVHYDVYQGSATIAPRYSEVVHGKLRDAMGGTSLYYDQRDYEQQRQKQAAWEEQQQLQTSQQQATELSINSNINMDPNSHNPNPLSKLGVRGQINPYFVPPVQPMSATYQEQLRHFFVDHIEPLYYISPNPAMPEEAFKAIVKDIAKRYWFAYDKTQPLTDALKREIIDTIKAKISNAMSLPLQQREAMFEREKARADEEVRQRRIEEQAAIQQHQQQVQARQLQQQMLAAEWGQGEGSGGYNQQPRYESEARGSYYGITGATTVSGGYQ